MDGKVAIVTGGGIGSAICRRLAASGARVAITYRSSKEKAQAVATELAGDEHLMIQALVTDSAAMSALAERVEQRYGRLCQTPHAGKASEQRTPPCLSA